MSWTYKQFQTPVASNSTICEDYQLRVGDDWCPHLGCELAINRNASKKCFNIVVWAANSQETIRKLQALIGLLVVLWANYDELFVFQISYDKSVGCPNNVVSIDVILFFLFWVKHHSLNEEVVVINIVIEQVKARHIISACALNQEV